MRSVKLGKNQRGDTLVEVLLATVVLSIVVAGAYVLSNRALRLNQSAAERTEVVNKIREQTEMLSFISDNRTDSNIALIWEQIEGFSGALSSDRDFYFELFNTPGDPSSGLVDLRSVDPAAFVVQYRGENVVNGLPRDSYTDDIFTIKVRAADVQTGYVDYVVDAEWEGIGGLGRQEAANVLRLPVE